MGRDIREEPHSCQSKISSRRIDFAVRARAAPPCVFINISDTRSENTDSHLLKEMPASAKQQRDDAKALGLFRFRKEAIHGTARQTNCMPASARSLSDEI